jgi:predicted SPOUT superfamily RNA methylase MTH1
MKKKKNKIVMGGVLSNPTIAILSDEQQRGNYTGYSVSSKKLIELIESQNKEEITVQGSIIGHELVIKPKQP